MAIIEIRNLSKSYRVYQKKEGLGQALRGLFHREYKTVEAVQNVSRGNLWHFSVRMELEKLPL